MKSTYFGLLAEFGTAEIPLEGIAGKYFGLDEREAKRRAAMRSLPLPAYRAGSQKSGWLISASDLAKYLDERKAEAQREWAQVRRGVA